MVLNEQVSIAVFPGICHRLTLTNLASLPRGLCDEFASCDFAIANVISDTRLLDIIISAEPGTVVIGVVDSVLGPAAIDFFAAFDNRRVYMAEQKTFQHLCNSGIGFDFHRWGDLAINSHLTLAAKDFTQSMNRAGQQLFGGRKEAASGRETEAKLHSVLKWAAKSLLAFVLLKCVAGGDPDALARERIDIEAIADECCCGIPFVAESQTPKIEVRRAALDAVSLRNAPKMEHLEILPVKSMGICSGDSPVPKIETLRKAPLLRIEPRPSQPLKIETPRRAQRAPMPTDETEASGARHATKTFVANCVITTDPHLSNPIPALEPRMAFQAKNSLETVKDPWDGSVGNEFQAKNPRDGLVDSEFQAEKGGDDFEDDEASNGLEYDDPGDDYGDFIASSINCGSMPPGKEPVVAPAAAPVRQGVADFWTVLGEVTAKMIESGELTLGENGFCLCKPCNAALTTDTDCMRHVWERHCIS
jgi:hypothetical protein